MVTRKPRMDVTGRLASRAHRFPGMNKIGFKSSNTRSHQNPGPDCGESESWRTSLYSGFLFLLAALWRLFCHLLAQTSDIRTCCCCWFSGCSSEATSSGIRLQQLQVALGHFLPNKSPLVDQIRSLGLSFIPTCASWRHDPW